MLFQEKGKLFFQPIAEEIQYRVIDCQDNEGAQSGVEFAGSCR